MVSFQCDACCDVVKKPKLDIHRARCDASFTCIDCSTTFNGPAAYKSHTSCISEAQKYEKALYKGPPNGHASNGAQSNGRGRQNGYSRNVNRGGAQPRYQRPMGTGANDSPLGGANKMTYTPPNEQEMPEEEPKATTAVILANSTIEETAPEATEEPAKKKGGGFKKGRRDPPPPGETKAERKKRKKIEKLAKKKQKLFFRAQQKALKTQAAQKAKVMPDPNAEPAETRAAAKAKATTTDGQEAEHSQNPQNSADHEISGLSEITLGQNGVVEGKKKKSKKSKAPTDDADSMQVDSTPLTTVNEDAIMEDGAAVEKKSKKRKHAAAIAEVAVTAPSEKKSKKRKRDEMEEGEGGKENGEQGEGLTFKERARAEKKARKAEKAARKAAREGAPTSISASA